MSYFADFPVLRNVAERLDLKKILNGGDHKKDHKFNIKRTRCRSRPLQKLILFDHKKDHKNMWYFLHSAGVSICCYANLNSVFEKRIVISVKTW